MLRYGYLVPYLITCKGFGAKKLQIARVVLEPFCGRGAQTIRINIYRTGTVFIEPTVPVLHKN
jgi:hypothetical protein